MSNQTEIAKSFFEWEEHLKKQRIPTWEELPDIDLYMDQVLILLNRYTEIFCIAGGGNVITAPMINNYVKQKTVPPPEKKKYSKKHLAYLIMVSTLKQALSISTIEKMLPYDIEEERVRSIYNSFARNQQKAFLYVSEQVSKVSTPILEENKPERIQDLIFQVAVSANIFKTLTEQVIDLTKEKKIQQQTEN